MLNDSTDTLIYGNIYQGSDSEVYDMIDSMNNLALRDPLTGVYNKRYINEKLPINIIAAALSEQEISIIMADIDYFKMVNDNYGHLAGDEILKSFAAILSDCLKRESDWVARFGGEEFLVCLPGASRDKALDIAESMRSKVEAEEFHVKDNNIRITSSFGVASIKPVTGTNTQSLIDCADEKLYAAKNNGRNRVEY
jgi:diguanylate cyclase (GGDEF)-like protein